MGYIISISYRRGRWEFASVPGENTLIYFCVMYVMYLAQLFLTIVSATLVIRKRNQVSWDGRRLSNAGK